MPQGRKLNLNFFLNLIIFWNLGSLSIENPNLPNQFLIVTMPKELKSRSHATSQGLTMMMCRSLTLDHQMTTASSNRNYPMIRWQMQSIYVTSFSSISYYSNVRLISKMTFVLKNLAKNSIFASIFDLIFDSRWSNSTSIHQFYYSASNQLSLQSFGIHLDDEFWVGTPLPQNFELTLIVWIFWNFWLFGYFKNAQSSCHFQQVSDSFFWL